MLVPKLRFKREDGTEYPEWEEKELKKVAKILMGQSPSGSSVNTDKIGIPLVQGKADILGYGIIPDRYTSTPTKVSKPNDIIMTVRAPVGFVSKLGFAACIGRGVCAIRANEDEDYIYYVLQNKESEWKYIEQGSTFTAVNSDDVSALIVPVPCLEEQQKIADFLSTVDEVITQSEAEVQNLEQQKKAAMQKIFSQEVRFKREDGTEYPEWEEKKIGEITVQINKKTKDKLLPVYSVNNQKGFIPQVEQFEDREVASKNKTNYKIVSLNQFAYNPSRINVGSIAYLKEDINVIVSPLYIVFECLSVVKPAFIDGFVHTSLFDSQRKMNTAGSVRDSLSYEGFSDINIGVPDLEEQQKIADFLSAYDEAISYAKQELDKWKELKKGLLQQMFV